MHTGNPPSLTSSTMETELKLLLAPGHVKALIRHPLLARHALAAPRTKDQTGVYFDTPGNDLRRNDAGLRVRRTGGEYIQTLKAGGGVQGGLHQRNEWESQVAGEQPDLAALREMVPADAKWARRVFTSELAQQIRPIFATRIKRMLWDLKLPDGSEVEFVLDRGTVEHGDLKTRVCEIELELKAGSPLALFDFALQLMQDIPLRVGIQSKAQRGYALYHQAAGGAPASNATKAAALALSKKMSVEQAFSAIVGNCVEQIQANDIADGDAGDVERLHQMRVGLRRLRSAFTLFGEVIALPDALAGEFEWLSRHIGAARDWDVLAGATLASVPAADLDAPGLAAVKKAAHKQARALHQAAAEVVASPRYTALALHLSRWMLAAQWREAMTGEQLAALEQPLSRFARQMLRHDEKRMKKRGSKMKDDPRSRHRARIAAKRMRYDTEFFQALYREKNSKPYLKALSRLQDQLGLLNDISVANRLLDELQARHPALAAGIGYARGFLAAQVSDGEEKVRRLWKKWKAQQLPQ
ncbi:MULTISPECIES: CYTH and CHAD domain-containing protein [unclassified Herbaspirillum]|uniref:CYTH and CHAD domain-containing protein n=1 Tax=unclassified Herbaspirillum TaxID=2624150 RepID=UPI0017F93B3F|nr:MULTISPECIES: CYTH and CHAD domain-containing protein [unclassified Herbaspirillum]MBB5390289.1 inorganic triphosphatase YgiF [Herbaspirillum sp. SJZ102]